MQPKTKTTLFDNCHIFKLVTKISWKQNEVQRLKIRNEAFSTLFVKFYPSIYQILSIHYYYSFKASNYLVLCVHNVKPF
jgi:hypothetical protein